ncbi:MAG: carbohydrate kinase family protein [Candidatus Woesearchaeota archaeon]|jgi:sugar/nucleoside kinase (ribokinase family)
MYDVVTCGSAVVDVFVMTQCDNVTIKGVKEIAYPLGSKIIISEKHVLVGGGGTNTATSFARVGLKTGYLGCLGKDNDAKFILDSLKREKIDFLGYQTSKYQSGYSVVLDSQNDDRTILTYKGSNNFLEFSKLKIPSTKWIYSSSLVEKSFDALKKIAKYACKKGIKFAFNPSSYQAKQGLNKLKDVLCCTNLLVLNKEEAQELVGTKVDFPLLIKKIMPALMKNATLIITDGKRGAVLHNSKNTLKLIPPKFKVYETTGAGDSFASTYLSYHIMGKDDKIALTAAMENAKSIISHLGGKENLLTRKELDKNILKSKTKIVNL